MLFVEKYGEYGFIFIYRFLSSATPLIEMTLLGRMRMRARTVMLFRIKELQGLQWAMMNYK